MDLRMINGDLIFSLTHFLSLSHTACQHVAGAFPAGRNQTGATADRVRTNSGRIPSESHDFI